MNKKPEQSESRGRRSLLTFLALAGVLEAAFLVLVFIVLGVAYTVGLHIAILLAIMVLSLFGVWKWTARGK